MTSGQRKAHKYIWMLLGIVIPVIILFSIKDLTVFSFKKDTSSKFELLMTDALKVAENDVIKVALFSDSITVILKRTLKNPSSILYSIDLEGNKEKVIGQLSTLGIYNLKITELPKGILLYDILKEKIITKIIF